MSRLKPSEMKKMDIADKLEMVNSGPTARKAAQAIRDLRKQVEVLKSDEVVLWNQVQAAEQYVFELEGTIEALESEITYLENNPPDILPY